MNLGRGRTRRLGGERGATLVEFALIMPLLFALTLGIFTGGTAYNRQIAMTSAVREGARFGATLACDSSCAPSNSAWVTAVEQRVADASGGQLAATDVCAWLGPFPDNGAGSPHCGVSDPATASGMEIKVSASKGATLQVVFFSKTLNLTARSVNRYERGSTYGQV